MTSSVMKKKDKIPTVFINIDYPGEKGEYLFKKFSQKLRCYPNLKFNSFVVTLSRKYRFSQI